MESKIKIDKAVLKLFIEQYKATFAEHRLGKDNEIYKWEAVKCFQDSWDIDATDFPAMLKASLSKTSNLLSSAQFFPRKMIEFFAEKEPETVRSMFRNLFDESRDIVVRVEEFITSSETLISKYDNGKMTYQNPNSISTYLWLHFPDKYYIYKYSIIKDNAKKLCHLDMPTGKIDRMLFGFQLYDVMCEELQKDAELALMSKNGLTDDCWPDEAFKTLTVDMGYYISRSENVSIVPARKAQTLKVSQNIILFGSPGTGKTYSTVQYAVAIIEEKSLDAVKAESYEYVFARYLKYKEQGLIAFTTFHQAFGYEEFIEGIRPVVESGDEDATGACGNIKYEVRAGIFKAFCDTATHGDTLSNDQIFDKAWDALITAARNNKGRYRFIRKTGTELVAQAVNSEKFRVNWNSEQVSHNDINKEAVRRQWLSDINRDTLSGGSRWLFDAKSAVIYALEKDFGLHYANQSDTQNRVFIIDEINRGNISKIFGELITLIEPTKRIGAPEEHHALLPYSGQSFGVPQNVYIIGTMNTADRSIAMMDTALRRRFDFVEMQPESGLLHDVVVDGVDIAEMLDTLNKRITVLHDREHTIGHSYLLPLKDEPTLEKLAQIFQKKIIPLLQEFFYDDYEKIQLVLGDNQKKDDRVRFILKKTDTINLFGNVDLEFDEYYIVNNEAFREIEAYAYLN